MFDIGFWELLVIGVLGLVVLGPERLPVAIKTIRGWLNAIRNVSDTVKAEIKEELRVEELHRQLKQAKKTSLENLSPELDASLTSLKETAAMVNEPFAKKEPHPTEEPKHVVNTSEADVDKKSAEK